MTLKSVEKFEQCLTCALKNGKSNLVKFYPTLKILRICSLVGSFCHDTKE